MLTRKKQGAFLGDSREVSLSECALLTLFAYFKPKQVAQLMMLNTKFKAVLSEPSYWEKASQDYFNDELNQTNSMANLHGFNLFFESHRRTKFNRQLNQAVSCHFPTRFARLFSKQRYSQEERLAAAAALSVAVDRGDLDLLSKEYREILKESKELAPIYRNLRKNGR